MVKPDWYWNVTPRPLRPSRHDRGLITAELLPGGCILYRLANRGPAVEGSGAVPGSAPMRDRALEQRPRR